MGGTFSANPLTMSAGVAALAHYGSAEIERLNRLGDLLRLKVRAELSRSGLPAFISGTGSLFRVHVDKTIVSDYRSAYSSARASAAMTRIHQALLADGILLTPNCSGALSTPMTEKEVSWLAQSMADHVIREMENLGFSAT
jgi:glutamate-1-semialdehyde 2,1-aminomutase